MGEVVGLGRREPPPPPFMPRLRHLGVQWRRGKIVTLEPKHLDALEQDGQFYVVPMGAIACRGRVKFTVVLPGMGQKARSEYLAMASNDR